VSPRRPEPARSARRPVALPPLACRGLGRSYGEVVGIEGLDLELAPGEVFGLVGLNGAGKSTTLRLALGLLRPSAGEVRLFGRPAHRAVAERRRLGYLPSELALYRDRSGHDNLDLLVRLGGRTPDDVIPRRQELADRFGLGGADLDRPVAEMSHGMRQKLGLVQAFEHAPELVVLDEPSDGLDPLARQVLAQLLGEHRAGGGTVLLASHVLTEVERVADRVGLLHRGRLVALETARSLRQREALRVAVHHAGPPPPVEDLDGVEVLERSGSRLVLAARPPLDRLIKALARSSITTLEVHEPDLEDLLRAVASEERR